MKQFEGFPPGKLKMIAMPAIFFSDLLPLIDDLAELKVTLFCWWALHQKEGDYRYLRLQDFVINAELMEGLANTAPDSVPEIILAQALEKATARGSLLQTDVQLDEGPEKLYFVNTVLGRAAIHQITSGKWQPGKTDIPVEILPERPNVFALYEANIGPLTPLIVEELKDAERDYPAHWLEEAIQEAVENNARKWKYIRAVLVRWKQEGKSREVTQRDSLADGKRYVTGKYSDWIKS